ncbi:insulin receptor substrate 1-B [Genypterus blacodes]|uniref:insulin receptor substrate 1-B n=1 Tax=Genypterus blacodes TaxID=154954 RepID=UPI003F75E3D4
MESQAVEQQSCEDVRKSGYLRKQKSMHRRYFVLRSASERGPARLEYYESEKKFRGKAPVPKKAVALETCFNINKRADSKNKHMIVLYTRAESFAVAAENEADQDEWYQAMVDLQCKSKNVGDSAAAGDYGVPNPGPAFKEVWQVKVWPKGLGQAKNLVGIYRLCLTDKTVNFVKLNSDAAAVVLQLMNVRRCGHSENFFFVEVGRSAVTGPGEFWMQVDDSVVAQNMHETLLEAMKALSEEFRQRSKSQSNSGPGGGATASNPISVPSRRHHPNPPPSQVGFARRPRTEPPGGANNGGGANSTSASPTPRHSFPRSRTASDGGKIEEGVAGISPLPGPSSSPSINGSCSTTPILRSKSARSAPNSAAKTPLGLMRSISTPAPSPAPSLSSSSGHGSDFGGAASAPAGPGSGSYSRVPSHHTSVSGSPSDYGSSDEYGSSPGDHTLLPSPSLPGGSVGSVSTQSLGEEAANYILMGQRGGVGSSNEACPASGSLPGPGTPGSQPQTRKVLRRSSSRECEAERRLLSKRASLPPMALERLAPRQRRAEEPADEDSADYAIMSRSTSRESFASSSSANIQRDSGMSPGSAGGRGGGGYLDVAGEFKGEGGVGGEGGPIDLGVDNGYMSMLPGVSQPPGSLSHSLAVSVPESDSKPADDYMAMTPNNSVSTPQQIRPPPSSDGYMIMSPNSSCSPDQRGGLSGGAWLGSGSADSRAGSDYMNMSPISARSVNGSPPPPEHTGHLDPSGQQQAPKMVYSYYSLPRSYKHNPSAGHFDDGPGRGRRPNGGGSRGIGGGRAVGGHQEQPAAGSSVVGRHLSLSSSSYSSSSASSESLGDTDDRASQGASPTTPGAQSKDGGKLQQRRSAGGLSKQGSHNRSRPVSLFVDVSKANTLPRVRENPLPPEPKSPGEYVSIEFKGEKCSQAGVSGGRGRGLRHGLSLPYGSSSQQPLHRPTSCLGGFIPLSRSPSAPINSAASEYVNMDLGPSPSPSPLSLTPLGFPSFHTPPTPPTLPPAPKVCDVRTAGPREDGTEVAEVPVRKIRESVPSVSESDSPMSFGDYTDMAYSSNNNTIDRSSSSVSPKVPSPTRTDTSVPVLSRGLDFPLVKQGPNPDHGAKVIRADPQGRRRHCSETFLAVPSLPANGSSSSSSTASLFPEHAQAVARRLGFESVLWGNGAVTDTPPQFSVTGQPSLPNNSQTSSTEQGLNYIDLDLANKESPHLGLDGTPGSQAPARLFSVLGGVSGVGGVGATVGSSSSSSSSSLNTYASIDFYKSEELRTHQNGNKEGTEC